MSVTCSGNMEPCIAEVIEHVLRRRPYASVGQGSITRTARNYGRAISHTSAPVCVSDRCDYAFGESRKRPDAVRPDMSTVKAVQDSTANLPAVPIQRSAASANNLERQPLIWKEASAAGSTPALPLRARPRHRHKRADHVCSLGFLPRCLPDCHPGNAASSA